MVLDPVVTRVAEKVPVPLVKVVSAGSVAAPVGAGEVDRAAVAGGGVAVGVLGGDGEVERRAGGGRARGADREAGGGAALTVIEPRCR